MVLHAGYLPEWRYEGANWDYMAKTATHLLLFSLEPTPDGNIGALDRVPRAELLEKASMAATAHGTELLLCFGGNGRSSGFSGLVRSKTARRRFIANLVNLLKLHDLHGVDYNWEYPGYQFGRGYLPDVEVGWAAFDAASCSALVQTHPPPPPATAGAIFLVMQ